jgi:aspartate/methionine/tyrosine aminotransferase
MEAKEQRNRGFARRAGEIEPFLVMEVLERAQELERAGRSILHLEVGEPDFETPPEIIAAVSEALRRGETHYTHSLGLRELREAIAQRYRTQYGVEVSPEQMVVTTGSSPAMLYLFGALVEPGDEILVGTPHYPCYPNFIRFFGGRMVEVPTDPADGYRLDPEQVRRRITSRTRAILLNSPANPTGAMLDAERLRALAELGLPVVSDEIYHGLVYEERARSILEFTPNAYVLDGFSKRYAMTGWRLGWLVAPPGDIRAFQKMQQNFLISANPFVQRAGIAALVTGVPAVEAMRHVYDRRRRLMVSLFREIGFGIPVMPQGAFYVFADASKFTDDSYAFAFELLEKTGVGVAPGVDFGRVGKRAIRLSYASSEESICEAAQRLEKYLGTRAGQSHIPVSRP